MTSASPEVIVVPDGDQAEEEKAVNAAESVSFDLLQSCHKLAVDKWAKKSKHRLSDLKSLLPARVSRDRNFVSALHDQLEADVRKELEEALAERVQDWGIKEKLAELDAIVAEQEKQDKDGAKLPVWRPSGNPLEDIAAHDIDRVKTAAAALEAEVVEPLEKEVGVLMSEVVELRATIAKNEAEIDGFIAEVKEKHD